MSFGKHENPLTAFASTVINIVEIIRHTSIPGRSGTGSDVFTIFSWVQERINSKKCLIAWKASIVTNIFCGFKMFHCKDSRLGRFLLFF